MILNSIILENIRSYSHEEIMFPRGITLFEGDIGSGKSTVLMAIEFALFGLGSQRPESLLAKKEDTGYAILDFSVDGKKYEIKRALKRTATGVNQDPKNSYIKEEGQKEPLSPSELKQRILKILKFNEPANPKSESRIYRYAVFTPQEEMKNVLGDSKTRQETIRKAFGIEDYAIAANNAKNIVSEIKTQTARFKERFADISQLEDEIKASNNLVSEFEKEIDKIAKSRKDLEFENTQKDKKLKELQKQNLDKVKLEGNKEKLEDKISNDTSNIEENNEEIKSIQEDIKEENEKLKALKEIKKPTLKTVVEIETLIKKFQKINGELVKANGIYSQASSDVAKQSKKLSGKDKKLLQKEVTSKREILKKSQKSLEMIEKDIEILTNQKAKYNANLEQLKEEIEKFTKLGAKCPICMQKITKEHLSDLEKERKSKINEIEGKLKEIINSFFDAKKQSKKLSDEINTLESEIIDAEQLIPQIEEFEEKSAELIKIEAKIKDLQEQNKVPKEKFEYETDEPVEYLSALKDELVEFENSSKLKDQIKINNEKNQKLILKLKTENQFLDSKIAENSKELQEIERKLETFEDIAEKIESIEKEINKSNQKINELSAQDASYKQKLETEKVNISENKEKISESKKWKKEHDRYLEYHEWITAYFIPTLAQIEKQVLLSILKSFNETYNRWYSILIEDPTKESRIDEDFTPLVNQDGYEQEIEYLSGGEKTSIALAYRLTLNSLMRKETDSLKSNLLILDEPTDGFSKNQLGKIREVLDELKSEQIILVSHEKELETYVDNIFQISKQDGISKIVRTNN